MFIYTNSDRWYNLFKQKHLVQNIAKAKQCLKLKWFILKILGYLDICKNYVVVNLHNVELDNILKNKKNRNKSVEYNVDVLNIKLCTFEFGEKICV